MFKIALCQTKVTANLEENIDNAYRKISRAAYNGSRIIALAEMFNCPYSGDYFSRYAEEQSRSKALEMMGRVSREWGIFLVGGSIPELDNGRVYNTSFVFNPKGEIIAKHRKAHLFDVDIENGIKFHESDFLSRGNEVTTFETPFGRAGVCICYDIRFPEIIRSMALAGAKIIFVPAAFNMTTGPVHWELLFRARALDNQVYMAGISQARDYNGVFKCYGHSIVVNPWGEVVSMAADFEDILYSSIDIEMLERVRRELPLLKHRRPEVYDNLGIKSEI